MVALADPVDGGESRLCGGLPRLAPADGNGNLVAVDERCLEPLSLTLYS